MKLLLSSLFGLLIIVPAFCWPVEDNKMGAMSAQHSPYYNAYFQSDKSVPDPSPELYDGKDQNPSVIQEIAPPHYNAYFQSDESVQDPPPELYDGKDQNPSVIQEIAPPHYNAYFQSDESVQDPPPELYDGKDQKPSLLQEIAGVQFNLRQEIRISTLAVGQSVEIVYRNPNLGVVAVNLVADTGAIALLVNPRYNWGGNINFLYLNTHNGGWQHHQTAPGYPFPANGVSTEVTMRIEAQTECFMIYANGIQIVGYRYRDGLTSARIRAIQWTVLDNTASKKAVLEEIALHY
jgi:hypothetical protein